MVGSGGRSLPRSAGLEENRAESTASTSLSGEPFSIHVKKIPDDARTSLLSRRYAGVSDLTEKEREKRTVGAMPLGSGSVPFGTSHSNRSHARSRTRASNSRLHTHTHTCVVLPFGTDN